MPNLTDSQGFGISRPNHSVSEPKLVKKRNPLEVNVNQQRKFEAVDPFASNNPYSKKRDNARNDVEFAKTSRELEIEETNGTEWAVVRLLRGPVEAVRSDQGEADAV